MNKFIKAGILGVLISVVIHAGMVISKDISFGEIFPLYFMWLFFIATGIGQNLEKTDSSKYQPPVSYS